MKLRINKITINKFRNIENIEFTLGRKISMIVGHNGTGKSNILSLLTSASGTTKTRFDPSKILGKLQPDYAEYFSIGKDEDFSEYDATIEYVDSTNSTTFYRDLDFKTDDDSRAAHIVPRTKSNGAGDTIAKAVSRMKNIFPEVKRETRLPYATKYISLARVYPRGQDDVKVQSKRMSDESKIKYAEWYNSVLNHTVDATDDMTDTKKGTSSHRYEMPIKNTSPVSISTGQDSLSDIISSLLEFWEIKDMPNYNGGVLAIDEFDISFHPDAQERLLLLLDEVADELDLQIFLTTHSISSIKIFSKMIEVSQNDDYRLISLVNRDRPVAIDNIDYYSILTNMYVDSTVVRPKVKIYTEDEAGKKMLGLIVEAFNSKFPSEFIDLAQFQIIPIGVGKLQLQTLNEVDENFSKSILVFDGDGRFDNNSPEEKRVAKWDVIKAQYDSEQHKTTRILSENEIILPTGFAPEAFIFHLMYQYMKKSGHTNFWTSLIRAGKMRWTSDLIQKDFLENSDVPFETFQKMKKNTFAKKYLFDFATETDVIKYWASENELNEKLLKEFGTRFKKVSKKVTKLKFSSYFME